MSETYRAQCNSASGDYITAERESGGSKIGMRAYNYSDEVTSAFVTPDNVRTFARGILALADEIDGGEKVVEPEAAETEPLKVGDDVEITENAFDYEPARYIGRRGVLTEIDSEDPNYIYLVRATDGGLWWCKSVRKVVEPEAPTVAETVPLKVGDYVEITENYGAYGSEEHIGQRGRLAEIDRLDEQQPYKVEIGGGDWWCKSVRKVDEPADAPQAATPVAPDRAALLEQARDLMADEDYTAYDLIRLANYLAGE